MNRKRAMEILNQNHISEVYYNENPVWIQELKDNIATIGFIGKSYSKDVFIEDLYENDLYN